MLCFPALTPVANDAHAVGDSGECVVCSGENPPRFASAEMFGSLPSAIHFSSRCGSIPSKPRMTSFCVNFEAGRVLVPEQAIDTAAIDNAAAASIRTDLRMETGRIITSRMHAFLGDVRIALRRLRMAPLFTLFAVASLAVGVGVSTAAYSAVYTFFWTPLGIPDAEEIVAVTSDGVIPSMSWLDFHDLQAQQSTFRALGAAARIRTALASAEGAEVVNGDAVSGAYFGVVQVPLRFGRALTPADEREAARVLVIADRLWRTHFHSDPNVVGRTVRLGGTPFEIVGVVKGTFHGLDRSDRLVWVPITAVPWAGQRDSAFSLSVSLSDRRFGRVAVYGRLHPDAPIARTMSEVGVIGRRLDDVYPLERQQRRDWLLRPRATQGPESEAVNTIAGMILTSVGMLLLIACSNLANLTLAKGTSRAEETAVRSALGASRWRLVREQLIESAILMGAGGALGMWLLSALVDFMTIELPMGFGIALAFKPEINGAVLSASAASMVLALVVFGLWPAWQSTRVDVRARRGGAAAATPPRWRLHRNLVAWQVCGCVALTLVAAMSQRIIGAVGRTLPPIPTAKLAVAQVEFSLADKSEDETRRVVDAVVAGLRGRPGITRAVASTGFPGGFAAPRAGYAVTTADVPFDTARDIRNSASVIATTPGLFEAVGVPIIRGRVLTDRDDAAAPRVTVVSERLARTLFASVDVIGRAITINRTPRLSARAGQPESFTVVGVTANPDGTPRTSRGESYVFVPWAQHYERGVPVMFTAQTPSPSASVEQLRATIRRVDPDLAISMAGTGTVVLQGPLLLLRVIYGMVTALASTSLVLAMAGLFGVLSHIVLRRTREIGIRLALGADRARIFRMILRDGLYPVGKGIVLGLTIGAGARMAVRSWVVTDISAFEPLVFLLIPVPFVVAALCACVLPALRAARVDPNVALRDL